MMSMNALSDWEIIDGVPSSPMLNMQRDAELLASLESQPRAVLHFYRWACSSATYGHFVRPSKWIDLEAARRIGLMLARRPTGGGIIFHTSDLAFSVLIPRSHALYSGETLQSYRNINRLVLEAIRDVIGRQPELSPRHGSALDEACRQFCMATPTIYDVMLDGRKVGGAAQRRTKWGILHQGSIALMRCDQLLEEVLIGGSQVAAAMLQNGHYLLEHPSELQRTRQALRHHLVARLSNHSLFGEPAAAHAACE